MKKRYVIAIVVIILLLLFISWYYNNLNIRKRIESANYCAVDEDCIRVGFGCPFGCGEYINKEEENGLRWQVSISLLSHPLYRTIECRCMPPPKFAECKENKCTPKLCKEGVLYNDFIHFEDRECDCGEGTIMNPTGNEFFCQAR